MVSKRQADVAKAMNIIIKELTIGEKLAMRADWVGRHPGVKFVPVDCVIEPDSGAGKYYKDITEVNLCSYQGVDGIIITERNNRVRVILSDGSGALIKPSYSKASFKKNKDNNNSGRIRFTTIKGSSISCERVIATAYGWMIDALPENIEFYEANVMNWSGSLKRDKHINKFNFSIDNIEFCNGSLNKKHSAYCNRHKDLLRGDSISIYEILEMEEKSLEQRQIDRREAGLIE